MGTREGEREEAGFAKASRLRAQFHLVNLHGEREYEFRDYVAPNSSLIDTKDSSLKPEEEVSAD